MYLNNEYMLDELITEQYPLADINEAYDNLLSGDDLHSVLKL
jgi:Zn-dependent alcohol dehydrogenase